MNAWFPHCLRVVALTALCCVAISARADDAPVPLTVEEAREAQALFGFDGAIPRIVEKSFQEQPEYLAMTPAQRTCVVGIASPAFQSLFDEAFSQLFGDRATLSEWTVFSATAGGKIFIAQMRKAALVKVGGEAEPDLSAAIAAMTDAEKEDVRAFASNPASRVLQKSFSNVSFSADAERAVLGRIHQECGIALDRL